MKPKFALVDLPVYPKGVVSLSLFAVAGSLKSAFDVEYFDLNIEQEKDVTARASAFTMIGLKVSAQNFQLAINLSERIRSTHPGVIIIWGGEFATLLPDECSKHADVVVSGLFEPIAAHFILDFKNGNLQKHYTGENNFSLDHLPAPDFSILKSDKDYYSFMGLPLETSRGCTEKCAFCMVHVMQKKNYFIKSAEQLEKEIKNYTGEFINIIDYNMGVNKEHVLQVSKIIRESEALGWMAEMCIELLDDDELLKTMSESRCKMIYCGLESIDEDALRSVHKMNTNHIENYARIIRKVQSYGIQIAAGLILGITNTTMTTFQKSLEFFQRMGLVYVKLTFLTYNPGTKVQKYMEKKGEFVAKGMDEFDGVRMSFLAEGVNKEDVISGAEFFIKEFYSIPSIITRAGNAKLNVLGKMEFMLFSYCYGQVYREWKRNGFLRKSENFEKLLSVKFHKSKGIRICETVLSFIRNARRGSVN